MAVITVDRRTIVDDIFQGFVDWRKLLGTEKVTNGSFTGGSTGWTLNTGWTYNANAVDRDGAGTATMEQGVSAVAGEIYRVEYEITAYTDGSVTVSIGGTSGTARSSAAVFVEYIKAANTGNLIFTPTANSTFTIDNVSVKKVGYIATDGVAAWIDDRGNTAGKASLHLMAEDGTKHVFGDRVGIGTETPTALVHLKAGTATANTAPLKLTSGTLLTSPEAGTLEFVTDTLSFTITTGAARKTIAFLESPTFTGTVTLPTVTLGGTITTSSNKIIGGAVGAQVLLKGGTDAAGGGVVVVINGNAVDSGKYFIYTPDAAQTGDTERFSITGSVATSVAAWSSVYHTGMKFGLAGTATGAYTMDGATSGVVTVTVTAIAGTWTMTLPTSGGTSGFQLETNGSGVTSWTGAGSRREWKNQLSNKFAISPSEALDKILGTKIHPFRFKEGFGTGDKDTIYHGPYAEEAPWAMHHEGGVLNPISTFGYTVLAIQALQAEITQLKSQLESENL